MTTQEAIFAAGCFWGVQYYFDQVPGVIETQVGYTGGRTDSPTYEQVCSHKTGHAEAVKVVFNPEVVIAGNAKASAMQGAGEQRNEPYNKYDERAAEPATQQRTASDDRAAGSARRQVEAFRILLAHFFRIHDPTQLNRQGPDVGDSYRSAIFYKNNEQKAQAQKAIEKLNSKKSFKLPVVTSIEPAGHFWPAEDYHQKFTERTGRGMCHVAYKSLQ